ncbi:hypothetical protein, partial [Burkholderia humptydooensis]|uniref:hypothetical protein n=1 Tax=Burkholderia humptydooensis TaxID=430531 RepID=UPI001E30CE4E
RAFGEIAAGRAEAGRRLTAAARIGARRATTGASPRPAAACESVFPCRHAARMSGRESRRG